MKKQLIAGMVLVCTAAVIPVPATAGWDAEQGKKVAATIASFKKQDPSLKTFFNKAYGYAVYPTVGKGAIGIGGAHGKGYVYKKGRLIGSSRLTQVTIGFQLGGQAYSEIVFFKDRAALNRFTNGKLKLSAQASAVAAHKGAAANADYSDGVAIFTMVKGGLMYEASVGGQQFSFTPFKK